MAAYEAAEVLLLEAPRGAALWPAVLVHSLQVAVILAAAWVVLRALRERAAHEEALARLVESAVFAREQERRRIAYELHDGVSPLIVSAKQHAETARDLGADDAPRAAAELGRAIERLQEAVVEARRMLRALRPSSVDADGLAAAVRRALDEAARETGWTVRFEHDLGDEPENEPDWDLTVGPMVTWTVGHFAVSASGGLSAIRYRLSETPATVGAIGQLLLGSAF